MANFTFPILNSSGSPTSTTVNFDDMFVKKDYFLNGVLWSWGVNSTGELGIGGFPGVLYNYSSPILVGTLTNWKQITLGAGNFGTNVHVIKTDGTMWAWGADDYGVLGDNSTASFGYYSSPIQVGSLTNWKQIADGGLSSSAIKTDGTLWAWGYNGYGQLGNGTTTSYSSPIQVGSLTNWKQVAKGDYFGAAIKTDGTLWSWGFNNKGQLGNGTITTYSSPIQIGSLIDWKEIYVGNNTNYVMALKTDGTLWAWGGNQYGQLGLGDTIDRSSPVQVSSLTDWKQISLGQTHAIAIKTDGTLWAWGGNQYGQLGNGNTTLYSSPIQVGSLTNWKQISGGVLHTGAIKTDGTLWTWGYNNSGQLGDGTGINKSSPVQIGRFTSWKQIACAEKVSLAIASADIF
jgi:hypothetical protein